MSDAFKIRLASIEDSGTILEFIQKIAIYEKMTDEVVNTKELIEDVVFHNNGAKVFLGEENGMPVGFALFFETYSTFVGRKGIHLEDLYVDNDKRGLGYGKALFQAVAKYADEGNYGRMEWVCLDWNTSAQSFYKKMGANYMHQWQIYRLAGQALKEAKNK